MNLSALISLDEKELLIALREGDQDAFTQIYDQYSTRIFKNSVRILKSEELGEELLQETFFRIWEKRDLIDPDKPIKSYLFRIAENLAYDFFRKAARDRRMAEKLISAASEYYDHIDALVELKENNALLQSAIDQLPPQRKKIFTLCKLEGKSYAEVSSLLGISESTINDHIVKATRSLKEYFYRSGQTALITIIAYLLRS